MTTWVVVPCDICNRRTVTESPDEMVVCSRCQDRWDAEEAEVPVITFDEEDPFDDVPF